MILKRVTPVDLQDHWKGVVPYLTQIVDLYEGRESMNTVAEALALGNKGLMVVEDDDEVRAVVLTEILEHPTGLRTCHVSFAGKGVDDWLHFEKEVAEFAGEFGCSRLEAQIRPGLQKKFAHWSRGGTCIRS